MNMFIFALTGYIKKDFEPIKKTEPEPTPPPTPKKSLNLV
jgi:hypothetical protein